MKKSVLFFLFLSLCAFSLVIGQQEKAEAKEDPFKNFSIVNETQPVPDKVKVGFESITGRDATAYLTFISSDLLEGRDTASRGYDIAAEYTASMFQAWGIKPAGDPVRSRFGAAAQKPTRTYFQNIAFKEVLGRESSASVTWKKGQMAKSKSFQSSVDYSYSASESQSITAPVVFVGYGLQESSLKLDEYKNIDVKGKFVLMLSETPGKNDPDSPFNTGDLKEKYYPERRVRGQTYFSKYNTARDLGAEAILLIENSPRENSDIARNFLNAQKINDERTIYPGVRRRLSLEDNVRRSTRRSMPTIRISRTMADAILGLSGMDVKSLKSKIEKDLQSQSQALNGVTFTVKSKVESKLVNSMNVLGYIEGSDPELKNEAIVIGGHLDHLGRRGDYIYNGADDDGSGSVGVMEIAEAFAKNSVKPKRSIVFALWTGEEKGLLGSTYYVAYPFIPKTYANINLDMISRTYGKEALTNRLMRSDKEGGKIVAEKIDENKYVNFSYDANTPAIGKFVRANNDFVGLHISIRASETASGGSDHAPFARAKLPWSFFIAAMTEDYHRPSDTVDKINATLMEKIIRLSYLIAFDLADME